MKRAIVFVDANNWYHNVKNFFEPGKVDIVKLANLLCNVKKYELLLSLATANMCLLTGDVPPHLKGAFHLDERKYNSVRAHCISTPNLVRKF